MLSSAVAGSSAVGTPQTPALQGLLPSTFGAVELSFWRVVAPVQASIRFALVGENVYYFYN